MNTTTRNDLTPLAHFFLAPENPLHRQYEAFRAYFVEGALPTRSPAASATRPAPSASSATSSAMTPTSDAASSSPSSTGPRYAPARDRVRELVVAMRKRNLSVYDIQRELAQAGHTISINALAVLLREEGFARLPRRLDDERPAVARPEIQATADVRALSLRTPLLPHPPRRPLPLRPAPERHPPGRSPAPGRPPRFADDPRRAGRAHPAGPQTRRHGTQEPRHGPGLRPGHRPVRRPQRGAQTLLPGQLQFARRSPGRGPPHGGLVRRGAAGRAATRRFHRPRFPLRARQHPGRTAGKTLHFQPQPQPAGRAGLPGPRCRRPRPVLRPRRHPQGPEGGRDPALRRVLARTHRQPARRTGLRFATDHLPTPAPVEPARHPLPDAPPPHAADARPHLESARVGLAAYHLAVADPRLPHAPCPRRTRSTARLRGRSCGKSP